MASTTSVGMPSIRQTTFVQPPGSIDSGTSEPARPFAASFRVPSPPNATTRSNSSPTASRVSSVAWFGPLRLDRLDVVAASQRVHDEVLEPRRDGRRHRVDDQQHAAASRRPAARGSRRRSTVPAASAGFGGVGWRQRDLGGRWTCGLDSTPGCGRLRPAYRGRADDSLSQRRLEVDDAVALDLAHAAVVRAAGRRGRAPRRASGRPA